MPRKTLNTDNWILKNREGETIRFSTYSDAAKEKRKNPSLFATTEDITFSPRSK